MPIVTCADVLDERRNAVVHRDDDVADVVQRREPAEAADVVELAAFRIESAAAVAVVRAERALDLLRRQPRAGEAILVEQHLVLHRPAAEAGIVRDAGHRPELRLDRPVLERLELGRRAVGALQRVAVDQPRRRGQRRDVRRDPARQVEVGQSIEHLLPGEIPVGVLVERDVDGGQSVERDRAKVILLRDAVHLALDRNGDQPFHLFRRVAGPLGGDRDHRRRQVGISVDRQPLPRADAGGDQQHRQERDEDSLLEAEGDDPVDEGGAGRRRLGRILAHWLCMNWRKIAPFATILSPLARPLVTS